MADDEDASSGSVEQEKKEEDASANTTGKVADTDTADADATAGDASDKQEPVSVAKQRRKRKAATDGEDEAAPGATGSSSSSQCSVGSCENEKESSTGEGTPDEGTVSTANADYDNGPPPPQYEVGQRIYARDEKRGVMYEAIVRRHMHGPRSVQSLHGERLRRVITSNDAETGLEQYDDEELLNEVEMDATRPENYCWHYFVHYNKWNVKWDEWVEERSVWEYTDDTKKFAKLNNKQVEDGLKRRRKRSKEDRHSHDPAEEEEQRKLLAQQKKKMASKAYKKQLAAMEQQQKRLRRLRRNNLLEERKRTAHARRLPLPMNLKRVLVDEWEIICCKDDDHAQKTGKKRGKMLPVLPAATTIDMAMEWFLQSKLDMTGDHQEDKDSSEHQDEEQLDTKQNVKSEESEPSEWMEMVQGIKALFNVALPIHLLYPQEMPQHQRLVSEYKTKRKTWTDVYGCEHLLRLLVKLPALMASSSSPMLKTEFFDATSKLRDLLSYLQRHHRRCFSQTYQEHMGDDKHIDDQIVAKEAKVGVKEESTI